MNDKESQNTDPNSSIGKIGWIDLTVENATEVRSFYESVVGWKAEATPVADYEDYTMFPSGGGDPVAGICHRKGDNAEIPSQWMVYIGVADLAESMKQCEANGGEIVCPERDLGSYGKLCVIKDPAGAVVAIIESPS